MSTVYSIAVAVMMMMFSFIILHLFHLQAFVDTNPNLRWCPHPGCGRAVKLPEMPTSLPRHSASANAKAKAVDCGDGHYFCW